MLGRFVKECRPKTSQQKIRAGMVCVFALATLTGSAIDCTGQSRTEDAAKTGAGNLDAQTTAETMEQLVGVRDAFVQRIAAVGLNCAIAPPNILIQPVPSFGNYDPATNTLQTPAWQQLTTEERGLFFRLAGPGANEDAARHFFETGTHRWVFMHEMGHWWQACRHISQEQQHYRIEYGANRIAAAYWREADPEILAIMAPAFEHSFSSMPNPVPAGQSAEKYLDDNYERLGPTPAYRWYQSRMIVAINEEKPAPSFLQALQDAGKEKMLTPSAEK
jgi:hypothetical protein